MENGERKKWVTASFTRSQGQIHVFMLRERVEATWSGRKIGLSEHQVLEEELY